MTDLSQMRALYRTMVLARRIDDIEQNLVAQGLASFHVSGAGHEALVGLAGALIPEDMLHLHYRDKALMLARGLPPEEFFRSVLATHASQSRGRQMSAHISNRALNITSIVGPVGNNALHATGSAAALKRRAHGAISVCCLGDGTSQQGEFYEAAAEAARDGLPVLFVVEDNGFAISTPTGGRTFYDTANGPQTALFGIPVHRHDGHDTVRLSAELAATVAAMRRDRRPAVAVIAMERLSSHTNSDDQAIYRRPEDIAAAAARDPIGRMRQALSAAGVNDGEIAALEAAAEDAANAALSLARHENLVADPSDLAAPYPAALTAAPEYAGGAGGTLTMRQAINQVLRDHLAADAGVHLFGQDIEDPKGDVFGVTKDLSSLFPGRVRNSALSEATIIGTAIGQAMAGDRPVAFIQFADFLPLGANQIMSELASLYWRTNGSWECPVILMAPVGAYKAGLGPFHAQTMESWLAQVPGIDVVMPSTAGDAAGLLNAAFRSRRPTIFLYPKALLNARDAATTADTERQHVLPGRARRLQAGTDLSLITYGNTVAMCQRAVRRLAEEGVSIDLFDLRSIAPWDRAAITASVSRTGRLVIAHEDQLPFGVGAEIAAVMAETAGRAIAVRRIGRPAGFVPFNFKDQLDYLPSYETILTACADLTGFDVRFAESRPLSGDVDVAAIGSGPADDYVKVLELHAAPGDFVAADDIVAVVEATKAAVEIAAQHTGRVTDICVAVGDEVKVGTALMRLAAEAGMARVRSAPAERVAHLVRREQRPQSRAESNRPDVLIGSIGICGGAREVTTAALCDSWPGRTPEGLIKTTGIHARRWIGPGQTLVGMATEAARAALAADGLDISDIGLVIASTGTPDQVTPSLAARVHAALAGDAVLPAAAFDINAACSGYIYALQAAYDAIAHAPDTCVLVITAEILSPLLNMDDPDTACIFADAATATIVGAARRLKTARLSLDRPVLSGRPEGGRKLKVPLPDQGFVEMRGAEVFSEAVASMKSILRDACERAEPGPVAPDIVVPHQANQRIIAAVERHTKLRCHSVIDRWGNTSSSSIPIALDDFLKTHDEGRIIGLVAFGGGMTFAAAVARRV